MSPTQFSLDYVLKNTKTPLLLLDMGHAFQMTLILKIEQKTKRKQKPNYKPTEASTTLNLFILC